MSSRRAILVTVIAVVASLSLAAAQAAPNDPHFPAQWGLTQIGAPEGWTLSRGAGVVVAVIDSGVDLTHPDLVDAFAGRPDGRILGYDFVDGDEDPTDEHGHGTMVAGIIAARTSNGIGVASVAPQARLMPIRVLDREAAGTSDHVDAAIRWAVDNGAHVINLSLEVHRDSGVSIVHAQQAPDAAVRYAWQRGVAVVAAAGNDSDAFTDFAADVPVLLVGATDQRDQPANFSDFGRRDAVMAPGVEIRSTWCDPCGAGARHSIGQSSGTSYAAPHVAATVALLRASGSSSAQAVERVRATAVDLGTPGPDSRTGYGRLDAAAAVGVRTTRSEPAGQVAPSPPGPGPPPQTAAAVEPSPAAVTETPELSEPAPEPLSPPPHPTTDPVPAITVETPQATRPPTEQAIPSQAGPARHREREAIAPWAALAAVLLAVDVVALIGTT
ncbi:MAG: S8 family serine peptidase, partial [Actinomycetota bacterium]|nr:S8 family serine peptidase [Actinomycetota bacterium]